MNKKSRTQRIMNLVNNQSNHKNLCTLFPSVSETVDRIPNTNVAEVIVELENSTNRVQKWLETSLTENENDSCVLRENTVLTNKVSNTVEPVFNTNDAEIVELENSVRNLVETSTSENKNCNFVLQEYDCSTAQLKNDTALGSDVLPQQNSSRAITEANTLYNISEVLHEKDASRLALPINSDNNNRAVEIQSPSETSSSSSSDSSSQSSSESHSSKKSDLSKGSRDEPFSEDDSVKDPNYNSAVSSSSSENEEEQVQPKGKKRKVRNSSYEEKKTKKRKKNPDKWQKGEAQRLRNRGQEYVSKGIIKSNDGKVLKCNVIRKARCVLPACSQKCKLKCLEKILQDQREKIFSDYWNLHDIEKQREFLSGCMKTVVPRYKYTNAQHPRKPNNAYYFLLNQKEVRVCKLFFMATLSINHKVISTVLRKLQACDSGRVVERDRRGRHGNHYKIGEDIKNKIREHINSIPRIESHYCRSHSSREYIDGSKTIADLHRDYSQLCKEQNIPSANYLMYTKIFNEEFNLAFHLPKKDQCELCLEYKNSNEIDREKIEEKYARHQKEKDLSREEKDRDKNSDEKIKVIVFDLQAVLPCPTGDASSFYYVSKLNVLNFTLYDVKRHEGTCFMWHEGEAHRGANEIGTCLFKYLQEIDQHAEEQLDVIFYSDNCAGQNKNKFIITLYMHALSSLVKLNSITHKFFISGHSQNEGDSMHALIEKQITRYKKSNPIYSPDQYGCIIRNSKKKGMPYKVNEFCHSDVLDLKALAADLFVNNIKAVKLNDIKIFKMTKEHPGVFYYKTSFEQENYNEVQIINSRRKIDITKVQLKKVFTEKPGITDAKKKGLLSLIEKKKCVPAYYLEFYKNL